MLRRTAWLLLLAFMLLAVIRLSAQVEPIDAKQSIVTVRVFKSGLFSVFAHDHEIVGPIGGSIHAVDPSAEVLIHTGDLRVVDQGISDKERAEIQQTMLGPQVLDVARFPTITFRSISVERRSPEEFVVHGNLVLHGRTRPVVVEVTQMGQNSFHASSEIRQTDFGITPVRIAAGTVRVKDAVKLEFDIKLTGQSTLNSFMESHSPRR